MSSGVRDFEDIDTFRDIVLYNSVYVCSTRVVLQSVLVMGWR